MKHKKIKITALILAAVILLCCGGVGIYAADYYRMDNAAVAAMADSNTVTVELSDNLAVFRPANAETGLVFYPGGKVEYTAYAPLMQALAEQGILCVIPKMPLNLAVLDSNAAEEIPDLFPEIGTWYIGGHSLGGSMAASCAAESNRFTGLVLLAAYSTADLRDTDLAVLSVYGTEDKVLNMEKYYEYFPNLPEDTTEWVIDGGNHAQFGSYGAQEGDGEASRSAKEQLEQTVLCITQLMDDNTLHTWEMQSDSRVFVSE